MPIFSNGFEEGDFSAWTGIFNDATEDAPVVNEVSPHHGSHNAYFNHKAAWGQTRCHKDLGAGVSEIYVRAYVKFDDVRNGQLSIGLRTAAGAAELAYVEMRTDRWKVRFKNGGAWHDHDSGVKVLASQFYCLELYWLKDALNGGVKLWVDGVEEINAFGHDTADEGDCQRIVVGAMDGFDGVIFKDWIDCVVIDSAYIGPEVSGQMFGGQGFSFPLFLLMAHRTPKKKRSRKYIARRMLKVK